MCYMYVHAYVRVHMDECVCMCMRTWCVCMEVCVRGKLGVDRQNSQRRSIFQVTARRSV